MGNVLVSVLLERSFKVITAILLALLGLTPALQLLAHPVTRTAELARAIPIAALAAREMPLIYKEVLALLLAVLAIS